MATIFDLKIFNHIKVKGDAGVYKIYAIDIQVKKPDGKPRLLINRPHGSYEFVNIDKVTGVPLTEENVKLLGFKINGAWWSNEINPDWHLWNFTKKPLWSHTTHDRCFNNKSEDAFLEFKYLHELQNAFYTDNRIMLELDEENLK